MADFKYFIYGQTDEKLPDIFSMSNTFWNTFNEVNVLYYTLTKRDAERFDLFMLSVYGTNEYDSIVLWYNNIPSKYHLFEGSVIKVPDKAEAEAIKKKAWYI